MLQSCLYKMAIRPGRSEDTDRGSVAARGWGWGRGRAFLWEQASLEGDEHALELVVVMPQCRGRPKTTESCTVKG